MLGLNEYYINGVTFYTKGTYKTPPPPTTDDLNTFAQWIRHNSIVASIRIHRNKIMISMNHAQHYAPVQTMKGAVEFLIKYLPYYVRSVHRR